MARERIARQHPTYYAARVPYAWPGGYAVYVVVDADVVCAPCVKASYARYRRAERDARDTDHIDGVTCTQMDEHYLTCDDCGRVLSGCWHDPFNYGDGEPCEEGCPWGDEFQP